MPISEFLFDLPTLLVNLLKLFVEIMSNPVPYVIVEIFDFYLDIVIDIVDLFNKFFPINLDPLVDYFFTVSDLLYNAPFAFWILAFFITCGFVVAIVFFVLDLLDRINFLT